MDVEKSIKQYLEGKDKNKGRHPEERYASFDYCYNYFYSFYQENRIPELADKSNIQMSCFQIAFFLASWGMLRGSSFLIEKSLKHYEGLVRAISEMEPELWEIDVDTYDENNIELLMKCRKKFIKALGEDNAKTWDTLVTKIMLGVFANVPAFDTYFRKNMGMNKFNKKNLKNIRIFYEENKEIFDKYEIYTYDFLNPDNKGVFKYTKAKLVDMCGFIGEE